MTTNQHNTQAALLMKLAAIAAECSDPDTTDALDALIAAQPTPEPSFAGIAARKLADLQSQGYEVNGYSIQHAETKQRGFITTGGFVGWWVNKDHLQPAPELVAEGRFLLCKSCVTEHTCKTAEQCSRSSCAHEPVALQGRDEAPTDYQVAVAPGVVKALNHFINEESDDLTVVWLVGEIRKQIQQAARASLPAGGVVGYMNAGHVHELRMGRANYGYVYPKAEVGASVPVYATPQPSETQGRMQMTDKMLKVLKGCRNEAMANASSARVPECGDFGGIAQDLDWLVAELCPASPQDGGEHAAT